MIVITATYTHETERGKGVYSVPENENHMREILTEIALELDAGNVRSWHVFTKVTAKTLPRIWEEWRSFGQYGLRGGWSR